MPLGESKGFSGLEGVMLGQRTFPVETDCRGRCRSQWKIGEAKRRWKRYLLWIEAEMPVNLYLQSRRPFESLVLLGCEVNGIFDP
jgi:hypothetical protein